jgi:hypothetical protein
MALILSFFQIVFPKCVYERAKVAVGHVGFVQGLKVRLPAVEKHCIARFIFLFSKHLGLDCCGLTAINEVDSLGLRRQQIENCEGRENSIMLSLPEFFHWHLRDSLREKPHSRTPI